MLALSTFVLLSLLNNCYAIGPSADMFILNNVIAPDGFNRSASRAVLSGSNQTVGVFPGPLVSGTKHWHGLFQSGSTWADGPVGVTQCPITPGQSFVYEFSVPDQAGTFWYHSHYSTQYCDGLRGPLVVYDPSDPHSALYHTPAPSAGIVPTSDATLINGLGRYAGGPASSLAVITVLPSKRYRFRLVSISCDPNFTFSIDGHNMTIIEADGVNAQPLVVDSIQIFAGQRYSFILNTDQLVSNYWIRASPNVGSQDFNGGINSAILRYWGASEIDPNSTQALSNPMIETNLHPLTDAGAPGTPTLGAADVNLNFGIDFNFTSTQFTINGATFTPPSVPVLLQILSGAQTAQDLLPAGSLYVLPANSVIEISIPGGAIGSPHPFHLHGHTFDVIRSAGSSDYNYVDPVKRDVVSTGDTGDNVTIRFETNNAGPWIMHWGLAIVFAEDIPTISNSTHPASWDDLCPTYDAQPAQVFT
ncbi:hypothetical protein GALMADRAFT_207865 [Galerina marginata CBS 339.88]|uniref:Laccase n=1 Tax=Galerina marginata (strain CBS 339.88) TaxID=685588 RepID=A0A067TM47_GALM3|nr:hypothetical protein GALMADRAFT_207865 [Galerina marginata CBS 339.88]